MNQGERMYTCPTCQEMFEPTEMNCPRCGADRQVTATRMMVGEPPLQSDRYQLLNEVSPGYYRVLDLSPQEKISEEAFVEPSPLALLFLELQHPALPHLFNRLYDGQQEQLILEPRINHQGHSLPTTRSFWGYLGEDERLGILKDWISLWKLLPENYRKTLTDPENVLIGDYRMLVQRILPGTASAAELAEEWKALGRINEPLLGWIESFAKDELSPDQLLERISDLLATSRITWRHYAITDTGKMRDHNEDNYLATTLDIHQSDLHQEHTANCGLYVVCDGMGGHESGEVASALAIKAIREEILPLACRRELRSGELSHLINERIRQSVNEAILQENLTLNIPEHRRMGCTLVLMMATGKRVIATHVGDSRLYYLTRDEMHLLTQDHNIANWEFRMGRISEDKRDKLLEMGAGKALTQALGPRGHEDVFPEIQIFDIENEGIFLLCSDGLTDMIADSLIHATVTARWDNLQEAGEALVALANAQGGADNITVVLAAAKPESTLFPKEKKTT